MRATQIFLNGEFMGSTTVSGLPALQNLCQALNLDQNWAEEEKAFYITASEPVDRPNTITVSRAGTETDEVRIVLYPDPTIALPPYPELPTEIKVEPPAPAPVVTAQDEQPEPTDFTPIVSRVSGSRSASPDPRTPPGSGAVFVFRHASFAPGETLGHENDQLDALQHTFNNPDESKEPLASPEISASPVDPPTHEPVEAPMTRPLTPPLRSALRKTPPPRIHAKATRVIQSGATVIRL